MSTAGQPSAARGTATNGAAGRLKRSGDVLLVALFLTAIATPMWGVFRSDSGASIAATERRGAAPFPRLEFRAGSFFPRKRSIEAFPQQFEAWFNDHLGFRRTLIQGYNLARVAGLASDTAVRPAVGQAPRLPVIIGRDGWLFSTADNLVDDYRCTRPFTPDQLDGWKNLLTARRDWLRQRGIPYVVMVAPNAQTVYSEFMPRSFNKVHPQCRLDQLIDHLRGPDGIDIIDIRQPLHDASAQHNTYHKTDTHWNEFGAFIGYRQLMLRLQGLFPQLAPWPLGDFTVSRSEVPGFYLALLIDSPIPFREELIRLMPQRERLAQMEHAFKIEGDEIKDRIATRPEGELDAVVVLHDSFAAAMAPFLNEHARRVRYLWTYEFPSEAIESEKPQIVIQELVERALMGTLPVNPPELAGPAVVARRQPAAPAPAR